MSRLRLVMMSLFAVFVAGALGSASASAARTEACHDNGGETAILCIEEKEVGSPETEVGIPFTNKKVAGTTSKLTVTNGPTIECEEAKSTGEFDSGTPEGKIENSKNISVSDLEITFEKGCKVSNASATCKVKEPIVAEGAGDQIDGVFTKVSEIVFSPSSGTVFAKVTLENQVGKTCLFKGTFNVTGKATAEVIEAQTEKASHQLKVINSELKFGENPATLELTEEVALSGAEVGKKWGIHTS